MSGYDCSHFVCELLIASGVLPFGTYLTAQGLYNHFEAISATGWSAGTLAFYGASATQVTHVAFCLDQYSALEAAGGDHTTTTIAQAMAMNAFIKMRPIKYRRDFLCVLKPSYASLGLV